MADQIDCERHWLVVTHKREWRLDQLIKIFPLSSNCPQFENLRLQVNLLKQRRRERIIALEIERANMTQFAEDDDEDGSV